MKHAKGQTSATQHTEGVSRRIFLERLGAGALLGAAAGGYNKVRAAANTADWTPPPVLTSPNILIVMVDQMRPPMWMTPGQSAALSTAVLPNIMGNIQSNSYHFDQFFVAATLCTASRSCLLTGLYAPQTAMYITPEGITGPALNPAFPTWGQAVATLNQAYRNNVWWFGKWHLSDELSASPLKPYGFRTRTYPGGPAPYNYSPNGGVNEGTNGTGHNYPNDAMIAKDFCDWFKTLPPTPGPQTPRWCATVSLINPHDITFAPAWLQNPCPPTGVPIPQTYFPPPTGDAPKFYTSLPSPWNYEVPLQPTKPGLQVTYLNYLNRQDGAVKDWVLFLNQYFWLQNFVDRQVGRVLSTLRNSAYADNTIVIFLSDHGEYAGSHGLHTKGYAVYDESIRAPFYVQFPGQTGSIAMNQMCSGVDLFGLICDLATSGTGQWRSKYPDLANRQSMWSFLYSNSSETRLAPSPVSIPYIFHTFDDQSVTPQSPGKCHIVCMRTKHDLNAGMSGAKLAYYSEWAPCTTYPDATDPDIEFYDYTSNTAELGNDYYNNTNAASQNTLAQHQQVMGSLAPPATGLIASELNAPLFGMGMDGNPLSQAQVAAQQAYYDYMGDPGSCRAA